MRFRTLPAALCGMLVSVALQPAIGQGTTSRAEVPRVGAVSLGYFSSMGWTLAGEAFLHGDRFSAFGAVGKPVCIECGSHPAHSVGGGLRLFSGIPRVPFYQPEDQIYRVFIEFFVGPVTQDWIPHQPDSFKLYYGMAGALGLEASFAGETIGWGVIRGRGRAFAENCGGTSCTADMITAFIAWRWPGRAQVRGPQRPLRR